MFKWVTGLFESEENKSIRQRSALVKFLDSNIYNIRRWDVWLTYATLNEQGLKGDAGYILKNTPNKLLLHTTEHFLEGWG